MQFVPRVHLGQHPHQHRRHPRSSTTRNAAERAQATTAPEPSSKTPACVPTCRSVPASRPASSRTSTPSNPYTKRQTSRLRTTSVPSRMVTRCKLHDEASLSGPSVLLAIGIGFRQNTCGVANAHAGFPQVRYEIERPPGVAEFISYQTDIGRVRQRIQVNPRRCRGRRRSSPPSAAQGVLVISAQEAGSPESCKILLTTATWSATQRRRGHAPARTVCSH